RAQVLDLGRVIEPGQADRLNRRKLCDRGQGSSCFFRVLPKFLAGECLLVGKSDWPLERHIRAEVPDTLQIRLAIPGPGSFIGSLSAGRAHGRGRQDEQPHKKTMVRSRGLHLLLLLLPGEAATEAPILET